MKLNLSAIPIDQLTSADNAQNSDKEALDLMMVDFGIESVMNGLRASSNLYLIRGDDQFNWTSYVELAIIAKLMGERSDNLSSELLIQFQTKLIGEKSNNTNKFMMYCLLKILFGLETPTLAITPQLIDLALATKEAGIINGSEFGISFTIAASLKILYPERSDWYDLPEAAWEDTFTDFPQKVTSWAELQNCVAAAGAAKLLTPERVMQLPFVQNLLSDPAEIMRLYKSAYLNIAGASYICRMLFWLYVLCADQIEFNPFRLVFATSPTHNPLTSELIY